MSEQYAVRDLRKGDFLRDTNGDFLGVVIHVDQDVEWFVMRCAGELTVLNQVKLGRRIDRDGVQIFPPPACPFKVGDELDNTAIPGGGQRTVKDTRFVRGRWEVRIRYPGGHEQWQNASAFKLVPPRPEPKFKVSVRIQWRHGPEDVIVVARTYWDVQGRERFEGTSEKTGYAVDGPVAEYDHAPAPAWSPKVGEWVEHAHLGICQVVEPFSAEERGGIMDFWVHSIKTHSRYGVILAGCKPYAAPEAALFDILEKAAWEGSDKTVKTLSNRYIFLEKK